jgi:hypothetical protein
VQTVAAQSNIDVTVDKVDPADSSCWRIRYSENYSILVLGHELKFQFAVLNLIGGPQANQWGINWGIKPREP